MGLRLRPRCVLGVGDGEVWRGHDEFKSVIGDWGRQRRLSDVGYPPTLLELQPVEDG